jgi:hypothetical protein
MTFKEKEARDAFLTYLPSLYFAVLRIRDILDPDARIRTS